MGIIFLSYLIQDIIATGSSDRVALAQQQGRTKRMPWLRNRWWGRRVVPLKHTATSKIRSKRHISRECIHTLPRLTLMQLLLMSVPCARTRLDSKAAPVVISYALKSKWRLWSPAGQFDHITWTTSMQPAPGNPTAEYHFDIFVSAVRICGREMYSSRIWWKKMNF